MIWWSGRGLTASCRRDPYHHGRGLPLPPVPTALKPKKSKSAAFASRWRRIGRGLTPVCRCKSAGSRQTTKSGSGTRMAEWIRSLCNRRNRHEQAHFVLVGFPPSQRRQHDGDCRMRPPQSGRTHLGGVQRISASRRLDCRSGGGAQINAHAIEGTDMTTVTDADRFAVIQEIS